MNLSPDINQHPSQPLSSTHWNSHGLCLLHTGTLTASAYHTLEFSWPLLVAHRNHGPCFCTLELMVTTDVHWNLAYELHSHCCGTLELFFSVTILFIMSGKSPFDKLNETNHNNWKIQMEALLKEKGLFGVTCGCDIMPATGPNLKGIHTFIEKQRLTHAKIILCIEPSQIPHI